MGLHDALPCKPKLTAGRPPVKPFLSLKRKIIKRSFQRVIRSSGRHNTIAGLGGRAFTPRISHLDDSEPQKSHLSEFSMFFGISAKPRTAARLVLTRRKR